MSISEFGLNVDDTINSENIENVVNYIQSQFGEDVDISYEEVNGEYIVYVNGEELFLLNDTNSVGQIVNVFESLSGEASVDDTQVGHDGSSSQRPQQDSQMANFAYSKISINLMLASEIMSMYDEVVKLISDYPQHIRRSYITDLLRYYYNGLRDNTAELLYVLTDYINALSTTIDYCIQLYLMKDESDYHELESICNELWGALDNRHIEYKVAASYDLGNSDGNINSTSLISRIENNETINIDEYVEIMENLDDAYAPLYQEVLDDLQLRMQASYQNFLRERAPQMYNLMFQATFYSCEGEFSNLELAEQQFVIEIGKIYSNERINEIKQLIPEDLWGDIEDNDLTYDKAILILSYDDRMFDTYDKNNDRGYDNAFTRAMERTFPINSTVNFYGGLDYLSCANTYYKIDYSQMNVNDAFSKISEFSNEISNIKNNQLMECQHYDAFYGTQFFTFDEMIKCYHDGTSNGRNGNTWEGRKWFAESIFDNLDSEYIINYINEVEGTHFESIDEVRDYCADMYENNEIINYPYADPVEEYGSYRQELYGGQLVITYKIENGRLIETSHTDGNNNDILYNTYMDVESKFGGYKVLDEEDAFNWFIYDRLYTSNFFTDVLENNDLSKVYDIVNDYSNGSSTIEFRNENYNVIAAFNDGIINDFNKDINSIYQRSSLLKLDIDQSKQNMSYAAAQALDTSDVTNEDITAALSLLKYTSGDSQYLEEWQKRYLGKLYREKFLGSDDDEIDLNDMYYSFDIRKVFDSDRDEVYGDGLHRLPVRSDNINGYTSDFILRYGDVTTPVFLQGINEEDLEKFIINGDLSKTIGLDDYDLNFEKTENDDGELIYNVSIEGCSRTLFSIAGKNGIFSFQDVETDDGRIYTSREYLIDGVGGLSIGDFISANDSNKIDEIYYTRRGFEDQIARGKGMAMAISDARTITDGTDVWSIIGDAFESIGIGFRDGVITSVEGVNNFFFADGIRTERDYRNIYLTQIFAEDRNLYKNYRENDSNVLAYLGNNEDAYRSVLVDNAGECILTDDEIELYSSRGISAYEIAFSKKMISQDEYAHYISLNTYKDNENYIDLMCRMGDHAGVSNFLRNASSGIGNMTIPLALAAIPYCGSYLSKAWMFMSVSGNKREELLQSGKANDEMTFLQASMYGLAAVLTESMLGGIKGIGDNAGTAFDSLNSFFSRFGKFGSMAAVLLSDQAREVTEEIVENFVDYGIDVLFGDDVPSLNDIIKETYETAIMTFATTPFLNILGGSFSGQNYLSSAANYNTKVSHDLGNGLHAEYSQAEVMECVDAKGELDYAKFLKYLSDNNRFENDSILNRNNLERVIANQDSIQEAKSKIDEDLGILAETQIDTNPDEIIELRHPDNIYTPNISENVRSQIDSIIPVDMTERNNPAFKGITMDKMVATVFGNFRPVSLVNTEYETIVNRLKNDTGVEINSILSDEYGNVKAYDSAGNMYEFRYYYDSPNYTFDEQYNAIKTAIRTASVTEDNLLRLLSNISGETQCSPQKARELLEQLEPFVNDKNLRNKYKNILENELLRLARTVRSGIEGTVVLSQESNGITYEVCGNNDDTVSIRIANVQSAISLLPPYLQEELEGKKIRICPEESPSYLYWRVVYDNSTHLSAADAAMNGDGTITIWGDESLSNPNHLAFYVLSHEMFHDIDGHDYAHGLAYSDTLPWILARNIDGRIITPDEESDPYGEKNNHENFAEAGRYFTDPNYREQLRRDNPRRYAILECFERVLSNPESLSYEEKLNIIRITGSPDIANRLIGLENCPPKMFLESMWFNAKTPADVIKIRAIIDNVENDPSFNVLRELATMDSDYVNTYRIYLYKRFAVMNGIKINSTQQTSATN